MESINVDKIQALRKYKEQQFVSNLLFYPLAILTFGLFCTCPFWFPSLYSSTKTLVCVSIPRIVSLFFSPKSLFILGNLIVIFLLRDSKGRPPDPSYNDNNGDNQVKPNLPKTRSKKAKIHNTTSPKKSRAIQPSKLLYNHSDDEQDDDLVKLTMSSTKAEKIQMQTAFSQANGAIVLGESFRRKYTNPYVTGQSRVSFVVEDRVGEKEEEEELLWRVEEKIEKIEKQETQKGEEEESSAKLKKEGTKDNMVNPAFPTDELKRRADDFIAMVNEQLRLEAEDVLLDDAC